MRFAPESEHGANAGLHVAREVLEAVKAKHPGTHRAARARARVCVCVPMFDTSAISLSPIALADLIEPPSSPSSPLLVWAEASYADLWILASVVAIKEMGGPDIPFHPGRTDDADNSGCAVCVF